MQVPPRCIADTLFQSITRTGTTWWCYARFWADRVQLHPSLSLAVRALVAACTVKPSKIVQAAVLEHARTLDLVPTAGQDGALMVRPDNHADPRLLPAAQRAAKNRSGASGDDPDDATRLVQTNNTTSTAMKSRGARRNTGEKTTVRATTQPTQKTAHVTQLSTPPRRTDDTRCGWRQDLRLSPCCRAPGADAALTALTSRASTRSMLRQLPRACGTAGGGASTLA